MSIDRKDLIERIGRMYTGIVSDAMDKLGLRNHFLPNYLRPLKDDMIIAGFAFTGHGEPAKSEQDDDNSIRFAMLEAIQYGDVPIWDCSGSTVCAHWGGMMTRSTRQNGGVGAVIDGGIRDVKDIVGQGFPLFYSFYNPGSSLGRWNIITFQKPIQIGGVEVNPGDFLYGDVDGLIVIPSAHIEKVLIKAEEMFNLENKMARDMDNTGMDVRSAFEKYGVI